MFHKVIEGNATYAIACLQKDRFPPATVAAWDALQPLRFVPCFAATDREIGLDRMGWDVRIYRFRLKFNP